MTPRQAQHQDLIGEPPDERGSVKPPAQFHQPGLFLTYGWQKGLWEARDLVEAAKVAVPGLGWIATQNEATTAADAAAFTVACRNALVAAVVWESAVDYGSPVRVSQGYDGYIGQIEGPGQLQRVLDSDPPAVPHVIVSNFGGLADWAVDYLADRGYTHCLAECWVATDGNTTPERQVAEGLALGFETCSPMGGLGENGATTDDYPGIEAFPGHSWFAGEQLLGG